MKSRVVVFCLLTLALAATALAESSPIKPGKWQIKMQMEMPGMPFKMPPVTITDCITEEEAADAAKTIPQDKKNKDCKLGDYKIEGNTISWSVSCPKQDMTGQGEITVEGDSYAGSMKMKVGEQEMSTTYTGKRLGDCKE